MTAIDAALAARVEAWVDGAGHTVDEVRASLAAVLAAGFSADRVRVVLGDRPEDASDALAAVAREAGVEVLAADAAALNARLDAMSADTLFLVRRGLVHGDLVPSVVGFMDRNAGFDLVYGDSATEGGMPLLRPLSSPVRLLDNDYLGPVVAVGVKALRSAGGFRSDAGRAQVLDIGLRFAEADAAPVLLPTVLATEDLAGDELLATSGTQRVVVEQALARRGIAAVVEEVEPFIRRLRYRFDDEPLVSIVIPTRGSAAEIAGTHRVLVVEAIRGILERSTYRNLEFVVVADAETPTAVIEELEQLCGDRLRLVLWDAPFNFSAKMNRGAVVANGEYLLLLNDDVEVVSDDWIESLLGPLQHEGVGIAGALLYFEDSTIQHAGQVYTGGVAGHAAFGWAGGRDDSIKSLMTEHEVSGVTAACALLRRDLYFEVGGFTLALPGNYNDVDLNMKIRATGRSAVFTPWARLYHFESKTRDPKILPTDLSTLQSRWKRRMLVEMYSRML